MFKIINNIELIFYEGLWSATMPCVIDALTQCQGSYVRYFKGKISIVSLKHDLKDK